MVEPVAEALAPWKVEDYLNAADYSVDPKYVPSDFALEFVTFIKLVNGVQGEEHKTPVVHYRMLDTITMGGTQIINLCHRGIAKTTVMAEYLFLYIAVYGELPGFGKINLALYVSDSIENGVKNMRKNLEFRYENSDFLKQYITDVRFTDIRWEFKNADGKAFIVKGYGAKTGVRGAKEMGTRPQLAVLDDLISDEDARSSTVISAVEDTVYKAVNYALHPTKNMIMPGPQPADYLGGSIQRVDLQSGQIETVVKAVPGTSSAYAARPTAQTTPGRGPQHECAGRNHCTDR